MASTLDLEKSISEYVELVKQQQGELIESQKTIDKLETLVAELYRQLEYAQNKSYDC
jgi:regulator of sirC expression with transglutaminase-like and TPR domain